MKIVFTGGGTAGHILPILALIRAMEQLYAKEDLRLFYIGPKDSYSVGLLSKEGVTIKTIITGKVRRYFSIKNFFDLFKIPVGFLQALFWLFVLNPDMLLSKGGYGSFPAALSAKILRVPIFLHESDSVPGIVSKFTSRWALDTFTSFPKTEKFKKEKIIAVGNPTRPQLLGGNQQGEAKAIFNLKQGKPLIFIMGGSQGAMHINNIVLEILPELLDSFEVVHQTGRKHYSQVKAEAGVLVNKELKRFYHPIPFLNEAELKHVFAASKLVVSRAGSGAIFEIAVTGKPSVLIPLADSAQDHQVKNAYQFAKTGATEVLEQQNLKPHFFLEKIKYIASREDLLEKMSQAAKGFAKPKSAEIISTYLLEYLDQTLIE